LVMNAQARHRLAARFICAWTGHDSARAVRLVEAAVAAGTTAAGVATYAALPQRGSESFERRMARTVSIRMLRIGFATLFVSAAEEVDERYAERYPVLRVVAPLAGFLVGTGVASALVRRFHRPDAIIEARAALSQDPLTGERLRPDQVREEMGVTSVPVSVALGFGVSVVLNVAGDIEVALSRLVARTIDWFIPGSAPYATLAGRTLVLGGLLGAVGVGWEYLYRQAEAGGSAIDKAYTSAPTSPFVSGGPSSEVDWQTLGREGVRFVAMSLPVEQIAEVTGTPVEDVKPPIRCYSGLETAETVHGRVTAVMEELERLGAFERSVICFFSPTGTGYINYVAIETVEYVTRGDCASVGLQYSLRPSYLSLDRVRVAREQNQALLNALTWRIRALPKSKRPRLIGFGESLGAQTLQSCFLHEGVQGFERAGMDSALFLGTPAGSQWKREWRIHPQDEDPRGEVVQVANYEQWQAATAGRKTPPRVVLLENPEDPITKFTPRLAAMRPSWLPPGGPNPAGVPESAIWMPYTTMLVVLVDIVNAIDFKPGVFVARGHDYRATLARMVAAAYRFEVGDEELNRIEHALRDRERRWAERRMLAEQVARASDAVSRQVRSLSDISTPHAETTADVLD
ncbi:MAG: alpha/beta-hydrolase family protein, partial [Lapillicoccus sp.]